MPRYTYRPRTRVIGTGGTLGRYNYRNRTNVTVRQAIGYLNARRALRYRIASRRYIRGRDVPHIWQRIARYL